MIRKPFAIRILTWFAALAAAGMFGSIVFALAGIGPTVMGGEHVTRTEWLHVAAPLVAAAGILMTLIAYGLAREKTWSRHLVITMFLGIAAYAVATRMAGAIPARMMWRAIANAVLFGSVSTWYFYFKPNVSSYFREMASP